MCVAYRMWFTDGSGVAPHTKTSHLTLSNAKTTLMRRWISPWEDYSRSSIDNIRMSLLSSHHRPAWNASITVKWLISPLRPFAASPKQKLVLALVISLRDPSPRPPSPSCLPFSVLVRWTGTGDPPVNGGWHGMPSLCVSGRPEQHLAPGALLRASLVWNHLKWDG